MAVNWYFFNLFYNVCSTVRIYPIASPIFHPFFSKREIATMFIINRFSKRYFNYLRKKTEAPLIVIRCPDIGVPDSKLQALSSTLAFVFFSPTTVIDIIIRCGLDAIFSLWDLPVLFL